MARLRAACEACTASPRHHELRRRCTLGWPARYPSHAGLRAVRAGVPIVRRSSNDGEVVLVNKVLVDKSCRVAHTLPQGKVSAQREVPVLDPGETLYHRLGGYDAIAAAVDDLLPRLVGDPQIGTYWKGKCSDSMKKDRQLLVDFLCVATGGPVNYVGRDMKTSHEGLGITESDWDLFWQHTVATLDDLGVTGTERDEFLAATAALKDDVVESQRLAAAGA